MKPNDFSDARVLVTGGAGFIGSALVWALNRRGCDDIVVCDRLGTDEKWRNLAPLRFAEFVEADDLLAAAAKRRCWGNSTGAAHGRVFVHHRARRGFSLPQQF
jgi:nucleoside-diphosphate-sugar epimerase